MKNNNYDIWLRYIGFYILLLSVFINTAVAAPSISISPPPDWVTKIKTPLPSVISPTAAPSGIHYLLVDKQINVLSDNAYFYHYAVQLTNEEAIEDNSMFSAEFDPIYQELSIHSIVVWRDGQQLDKLNPDDIELLQREKQLERLIYDGRWTASSILKDIRKGDILDYSYTIKGANPALAKHFSDEFQIEWAIPVQRQYYRLLWPHGRQLHITPVNTDVKIERAEHDSHTAYILNIENTPALQVDRGAPEWFMPWARVNFSDVSSWGEVVQWALPKYQLDSPLSLELTSLISTIRTKNNTKKQQVAAALEFVQNDVRYQGIELGAGGFQPHPPADTFARRYGDCKDKTTLLLAMLKALGVTANPVLVNTSSGKMLDIDAPRVTAFNHAIVQVFIDENYYWLDPTITNQYGGLDRIYQPNYGLALVLSDKSAELTSMYQEQTGHRRLIQEEFDLRDGVSKPSKYRIYSTYYGADAQRFRSNLNTTGQAKLEKDYLEYYSDYYPAIEAASAIQIQDDKTTGLIHLEEHYNIANFWDKSEKSEKLVGSFYSNALYTYVRVPEIRRRISPIQLSHPIDVEQEIVVLLTGQWEMEDIDNHVVSPFFDYIMRVRFLPSENKLVLTYKYKSLADYVPVDSVDAYIASLEAVKDDLDYGIFTYPDDATAQVDPAGLTENEVLAILFSVVAVMMLYAYIEYRFNQRSAPSANDVAYYPVSSLKFFILSVLTLGLYHVFWFYKNWEYVKNREHSTIMPWGRALFYTLWYYPLYSSIERDSKFSETSLKTTKNGVFLSLGILFFITSFVSNTESIYSYIALFLTIIVVLPLVERINAFTSHDNETYLFNSRWRPRHFVMGLFFCTIFSYSLAVETNLVPSNGVVDGSDVWQHDVDFMRRIGVIEPNESIEFFYSSGFLTNHSDGNGFSKSKVFSYWKNDSSQQLQIETARFTDISDIEFTYGKKSKDTVAKIIRNDGSHFLLFIATDNDKDRTFARRLNKTLKQYKSLQTNYSLPAVE